MKILKKLLSVSKTKRDEQRTKTGEVLRTGKGGDSITFRDFEEEIQAEKHEFIKEFSRMQSASVIQILRQPEIKIVEMYSLYEPWVKAVIVENEESGQIMYLVDEVSLTPEERKIFESVLDLLYWSLRPPPPNVDPYSYFMDEAKRIVFKYRVKLGRTPGVSWAKILYYVEKEIVGFGPIDPLMRDPHIEDISCDGVRKPVFVWHRRYEYVPTNIVFESEEELDAFVIRLAHKAGKHISVAFPILDAILPGGHRLAATYKREVSTGGSTFTIRKFKEEPITIADMIAWNTLSAEVAAYLWMAVEHKMTGLVLGVTGAGKTTTLNALATLLRPTVKVVTIEDTPELKLPLENWVQLVSRPSYGVGPEKMGEVTLYDLVKVALRYRPDVIIVGEVRGEEAYVLFQAMATGHGGMTTMHAEHIDAAVKRLTSPPMNIPPSYIPLVNFALVIKRVIIRGRPQRRITNIWEIRDYNEYVEIARWDPATDTHEIELSKSKILRDYAKDRGWSFDDVLNEFRKRLVVLKYMVVEGKRRYSEVAKIIHKYYAKPNEIVREAIEALDRRGIEIPKIEL